MDGYYFKESKGGIIFFKGKKTPFSLLFLAFSWNKDASEMDLIGFWISIWGRATLQFPLVQGFPGPRPDTM